MSIQGHADAVNRHLRNADRADNSRDRDRELHHARIAYRELCRECEAKTEKQVQRDSSEGYSMWKNGVSGLEIWCRQRDSNPHSWGSGF